MKQFIYFDTSYYDSLDKNAKIAYKQKVRKSGNNTYRSNKSLDIDSLTNEDIKQLDKFVNKLFQ
jgi:hypothetical protein